MSNTFSTNYNELFMLDSCFTCEAKPENWFTSKVFENIDNVQWFAKNCKLIRTNINLKTDWLMARHTALFKIGDKYVCVRGDSYPCGARHREYEIFEADADMLKKFKIKIAK